MDLTRKRELITKAQLIFYGIPVGMNAPNDIPIIGNASLAQIVANRINSIAKNSEEFKYLTDVVINLMLDTKGQEVRKFKFDNPSKQMIQGGITDQNGFLLTKDKYKIIGRA